MSEETQDQNPSETAPALPEFQFNVEDAGTLKKKVTITVPRERIDAKLNEMFGELGKSAVVPGFRVGHAPRRLIEKRFGREIGTDVRNALISESLQKADEKAKLNILGEPELDLDKIELPEKGEMTFSFQVEVAPEFELPNIEGIEVKKPIIEVNDAKVDEQLDQWRSGQAQFEATTEGAKEGDVITADVKISGEGFAEHHHKDHVLRVAPAQVEGLPLVELPAALKDKKAGESATLTVTVPEAHPKEDWRGKSASVTLTLSQVRRRVLPEINNEFAVKVGYSDLAELRQAVQRTLEARLGAEVRRAMQDQISKHLLDNTKLEVPEGVAARHTHRVLQRRYVDLLQRGIPREKIDENLAHLQAAASQQAQVDLKLQFILGKVAQKFDLKVEEGELNSTIAAMAAQYNRRPERMKQELQQEGTLTEVESSIVEDKALAKLLEMAKVIEVTPEQMAAEAKAQEEKALAEATTEEKPAKAEKPKAKKEKAEPKEEAAEGSDDKAQAKEDKPKAKKEKGKSKQKPADAQDEK